MPSAVSRFHLISVNFEKYYVMQSPVCHTVNRKLCSMGCLLRIKPPQFKLISLAKNMRKKEQKEVRASKDTHWTLKDTTQNLNEKHRTSLINPNLMIFHNRPSDFPVMVWNWWTSLRRQQWTIHRANEKRWDESPDEQTETEASSHLQCRPLNSDEGWNFRTKDERPRDGEREMREKMEGKQIRAHLWRRPLNMRSDTVQGL